MKALLFAASLLAGCSGLAFLNPLDPGAGLTPEQIQSLRQNGQAVYGCFQIGGPPPAGNMVWMVVPQGITPNFRFGDNCHIIQ